VRGSDGVRLWGGTPVPVQVAALALDVHGDAVVVGSPSGAIGAAKVGGAGGALAWSVDLGHGRALAVATDAAGDVLLTGAVERDFADRLAVFKLAGTSGATLWTRILPVRRASQGLALVVDAAGDALVAGAIETPGRGDDFAVLKLRARDGVIRWRRQIDGGAHLDDRAQAIALDSRQRPVAVGTLSDARPARTSRRCSSTAAPAGTAEQGRSRKKRAAHRWRQGNDFD